MLRPRGLVLTAALVALSCSTPPPPKVPEKPPEPEPVAEPPPKPEPKPCVALDEECKADADTRARVAGAELTIRPPEGWLYAQADTVTIAQTSDQGACFAVAAYETGKPAKHQANREATLQVLSRQVALALPKSKVKWNRSQDKTEASGLAVSMWELAGAKRADASAGPLLIFEARVSDARALLGVAFVPDDDGQSAERVLESVKSLAPAEKAASAEPDGAKDEAKDAAKKEQPAAGSGESP